MPSALQLPGALALDAAPVNAHPHIKTLIGFELHLEQNRWPFVARKRMMGYRYQTNAWLGCKRERETKCRMQSGLHVFGQKLHKRRCVMLCSKASCSVLGCPECYFVMNMSAWCSGDTTAV